MVVHGMDSTLIPACSFDQFFFSLVTPNARETSELWQASLRRFCGSCEAEEFSYSC